MEAVSPVGVRQSIFFLKKLPQEENDLADQNLSTEGGRGTSYDTASKQLWPLND